MIEFIKTKKNYIIALAVLFVFVSLSETTYSLFLKEDETNEFNYNTGNVDLKFTEDNPITLTNAFPMVDSEGAKQKPYKLTIKNTGSLSQLFDLKMLSDKEEGSIDYKYIKVKVNDYLPHTLYSKNNVILSNILLYPNEEMTLDIRIWLDNDIPNNELGKSFSARILSQGVATYKTLDSSGANHPKLNNNMLAVAYNETNKHWYTTDKSNNTDKWYDYNNQMWANSLIVKNSNKYIFDELRNNDLEINDYKINNGNIIIENKYLDIKLSNYNYDDITNIIRVKFSENKDEFTYIISNGNISYYYDNQNNKFIFKVGNNTVISDEYKIENNKWYIVGYSYNGNKVSFYVNGKKIGESNIPGLVSNGLSFKLGTDNTFNKISKITVSDILIYHKLLSDNEIQNNFSNTINVINEGLLSAYREFTPMTLKEYYLNKELGTKILDDDINSLYVWIPRFKYITWNSTGKNDTASYDAYNKGINIMFERGVETTGIITCQNNECYSDASNTNKISELDNGKYYTHPAFSTSTGELTGFWVSKYEVSTNNVDCNNDITKCNNNNYQIEAKANNKVWRNNNLSNYYQAIMKIDNNSKYRVIKNTEWGAITYLSHSKFGVCPNDTCKEIAANKTYISGSLLDDSTTGNIYGVYDMAGSATEYTMGNYSENNDINLSNSNFLDVPISNDDYDRYSKDSFILGDATKELLLTNGIWYNNNYSSNGSNWIVRGGNVTNNYNGIYSFGTTSDTASEYISTRIVLK